MCKTGVRVVRIVRWLTLLVGWLRAWKILLLVLVLVLTLGILGAIKIIVVPEVASSLASTIRSRTLVPLHLGPQIVGRLLAALVLKDWLREGGGRGRIYTGIAGRIIAVVTISSCSRKIQMKTIVGIHDGRNTMLELWKHGTASLQGAGIRLTLFAVIFPVL